MLSLWLDQPHLYFTVGDCLEELYERFPKTDWRAEHLEEMEEIVSVEVGVVCLQPIQRFALQCRLLLTNETDCILLTQLPKRLYKAFYYILDPIEFGFSSIAGLVRAVSHVLYVKGRGSSTTCCINRNFLHSLNSTDSAVGDFQEGKIDFHSLVFDISSASPIKTKSAADGGDIAQGRHSRLAAKLFVA